MDRLEFEFHAREETVDEKVACYEAWESRRARMDIGIKVLVGWNLSGIDDIVDMIAGPNNAAPVQDVIAAEDSAPRIQLAAEAQVGLGNDREFTVRSLAAVACQRENSAVQRPGGAVRYGRVDGGGATNRQGLIGQAHGELKIAD